MSIYTPQKGEQSAEILTPESRRRLFEMLPALKRKYPIADPPGRGHPGVPGSTQQSRALRVYPPFDKLLRGSENDREALFLRRESGLRAVRLRGKHGAPHSI
jgi:hypothetical protein